MKDAIQKPNDNLAALGKLVVCLSTNVSQLTNNPRSSKVPGVTLGLPNRSHVRISFHTSHVNNVEAAETHPFHAKPAHIPPLTTQMSPHGLGPRKTKRSTTNRNVGCDNHNRRIFACGILGTLNLAQVTRTTATTVNAAPDALARSVSLTTAGLDPHLLGGKSDVPQREEIGRAHV